MTLQGTKIVVLELAPKKTLQGQTILSLPMHPRTHAHRRRFPFRKRPMPLVTKFFEMDDTISAVV